MFIGHWAPALAAAAFSPRAPKLAILFVAAQLVDWAFFLLAWTGIEKVRVVPGITVMNALDLYHLPYTHSLLGTLGWAALFAGVVAVTIRSAGTALLGGAVVVSHWPLDWLVHRPDLTLAGGEEKLGLALWNHPMVAMPLELTITFGALWWYARRSEGPAMRLWLLGAVMLLAQLIHWFAQPPQAAGPQLYGSALLAFGIITTIAWWAGAQRNHVRALP